MLDSNTELPLKTQIEKDFVSFFDAFEHLNDCLKDKNYDKIDEFADSIFWTTVSIQSKLDNVIIKDGELQIRPGRQRPFNLKTLNMDLENIIKGDNNEGNT
jgi:hypothetical protein